MTANSGQMQHASDEGRLAWNPVVLSDSIPQIDRMLVVRIWPRSLGVRQRSMRSDGVLKLVSRNACRLVAIRAKA